MGRKLLSPLSIHHCIWRIVQLSPLQVALEKYVYVLLQKHGSSSKRSCDGLIPESKTHLQSFLPLSSEFPRASLSPPSRMLSWEDLEREGLCKALICFKAFLTLHLWLVFNLAPVNLVWLYQLEGAGPPLEIYVKVSGQDAVLHHSDHLLVFVLAKVAQNLVVIEDHHALVEVVLLQYRCGVQLGQRVLCLRL